MGDGGAAPMQVEIGEDDARDPGGEFIGRVNFFSKIGPGQNLVNLATFERNLTWSNHTVLDRTDTGQAGSTGTTGVCSPGGSTGSTCCGNPD